MPYRDTLYLIPGLVPRKSAKVKVLINSGSEVNAITPAYIAKLGLITQKTSVEVSKIDGSPLETYGIALASFSL